MLSLSVIHAGFKDHDRLQSIVSFIDTYLPEKFCCNFFKNWTQSEMESTVGWLVGWVSG